MAAIDLILFDVDGTLVDSQHTIVACMEAAFARHGLPIPDAAAVRHTVGLALAEGVARLLAQDPALAEVDPYAVAETYKEAYLARRTATPPPPKDPLYPGTQALLDRLLRQERLMGVATGKSNRGVSVFLETHGFHKHFVTHQTVDTAPGKPDPTMIRQAAAEAGTVPARVLMIGDTVYDMQMARAAGAMALGVDWGYHAPEALMAEGARAILKSWDDLDPYLT
ncbi:HAD-IA family hydrolase [Elstera litoralis]|uniref:HAD-IA family hydrolase n=1 Tax=Elstera litoralis TaxID=552518 RepID=UPI0012ED0430|nr:HAD-IA family hydrolase [Elstera litoralis]